MVSENDEKNLINFLLKLPNTGSAEHIFNMWNQIYDTSHFSADDIDYILKMIAIYKNINMKKDLKEELLKD